MEATIVYWGYIGVILGNGKENGSYYSILGLYRGSMGIMEKNMEATIMENQMEKKLENEMETREYIGASDLR